MPLPILSSHRVMSDEDLLRFYHRAQLHWCRHLGEEEVLDFGTALTNKKVPVIRAANQVLDAVIPVGMTPVQVVSLAEEHFKSLGTRCLRWVTNPSSPPEQTTPLRAHLESSGFQKSAHEVLYLSGQPTAAIHEVGDLTIIPARASYRHVRDLAGEVALEAGRPPEQIAEVEILHLDDPSCDALVAIRSGKAVSMVSVLAVGDIGCITQLFVSPDVRNQGIGRTMMSRAIEICARSIFKHVFVGCDSDNAPAMHLYERFGFRRVGPYVAYVLPTAVEA